MLILCMYRLVCVNKAKVLTDLSISKSHREDCEFDC